MLGWRRSLGTFATAAIAAVLLASVAQASGVTAEQLIGIAEAQLGMVCGQVNPQLEHCATPSTSGDQWTADIEPASGAVTGLTTVAFQFVAPLDPGGVAMMQALHVPTCVDRVGVDGFIQRVGSLTQSGTLAPQTVGVCMMRGELVAAPRSYTYTVRADVIQPATPTPSPTASPTAAVTPRPTPSVTNSPTPTLIAQTPSPTQSAAPTPSPSPTPVFGGEVGAGPSVSPTAEGKVAAAQGGPEPAPAANVNQISGLGFASSVMAPSQVRLDPVAVGASALLALLLLLLMAFPGELFNSTVEDNYDEIAGWLGRLRVGAVSGIWHGPIGVVLLLLAGALVYSLLDPGFGTDLSSVASYTGLLAGLVVVLTAFEVPGLLMHRRRTGEFGALRALPWTLVAGAACVLVSRLAGFEPGYLYGVLLGVVFHRPQQTDDDGRQAAAGALVTLLVALCAWGALGWVRANLTDASFVRLAGETALAAVVVAGLESVAFGLMPFRFLDGAAVRDWNRVVWAVLFGLGVFAFVHVLIGPQSGYLAELAPAGLVAALIVFAAFALLSFGVWGYFRFRPSRS
jgi:hypothetical protein